MIDWEAEERAEALLQRFLTPEQWKRYADDGSIELPGRDGTVLRIIAKRSSSLRTVAVRRFRGKRFLAAYCAGARKQPGSNRPLPLADRVLTLLVWLTCDRRTFYRRARRFGGPATHARVVWHPAETIDVRAPPRKKTRVFRRNAENLNTTA